MIRTDRFVFVHVHKTGGSSLNAVIEQCLANQPIGYHYPYATLPDEHRHLPVLAVVRNPWDWYVSWYAFNRKLGMHNALFIVLSDGGKADFRTTITNLVTLGEDSTRARQHRAALAAILPVSFGTDRLSGLTCDCIRSCNDPHVGYFSWLFRRMLAGAEPSRLHVARFENLEHSILRIMDALDVPERTQLSAALQRDEKKNSSSHSHYSHYYDDALAELVGRQEHRLIEEFGYKFERQPAIEQRIPLPDFYSLDVGFRKLLDRESNFLQISSGVNITPFLERIAGITDQEWAESRREETYQVHRKTRSLVLMTDHFTHLPPTTAPMYERFEHALKPILDTIRAFYGGNGLILRILLVRLPAGEPVDPHFDEFMSLLHCHRIHVPITTNAGVMFCVGGEQRHLASGEIWEINNATVHSVENRGHDERIHLITDWAPRATIEQREALTRSFRGRGSQGRAVPPPLPAARPTAGRSPLGRNEPCHCGSGERFKKCHGKLS
jgi:hypothetical protein